jgi:hypothetical protein
MPKKELTLLDLLSFLVYILKFLRLNGLKKGPNPCYEALFSVLEEVYRVIDILVDLHC